MYNIYEDEKVLEVILVVMMVMVYTYYNIENKQGEKMCAKKLRKTKQKQNTVTTVGGDVCSDEY